MAARGVWGTLAMVVLIALISLPVYASVRGRVTERWEDDGAWAAGAAVASGSLPLSQPA